LATIGQAGILPDVSAEKLLTIAKIAYEEFDSDLRAALKRPLSQAKKALKRFPASAIPARRKYSSSPVPIRDGAGLEWLASAVSSGVRRGAQGLFNETAPRL
jgi:hypothetical protein